MTLMETWLQILLTAVVTAAGSSGLWAYLQQRDKKKSHTERLLQGLAYQAIISMGMDYKRRGWITNDEYEDFFGLYDAYKGMGGNGVTLRVAAAVDDLPMLPKEAYSKVIQNAGLKGQEERDATELDAAA